MKGCSLAWNIDPNGITILHQRVSDGGERARWRDDDDDREEEVREDRRRRKSSLPLPASLH